VKGERVKFNGPETLTERRPRIVRYEPGGEPASGFAFGILKSVGRAFDLPLLLITPPCIAHCMGACSAKGS
jgi:hypothetical protein